MKQTRDDTVAEFRASAPGRVNLLGEHTDYNGGWVLPLTIPLKTEVTVTCHDADEVIATSSSMDPETMRYRPGAEVPQGAWVDYIQGVTRALAEAGQRSGGFRLSVHSTIPPGSGLGSSAALEVALLRALRLAFGLTIDDVQLALLGQAAENRFVGAQTGVMDQLAASLGVRGQALAVNLRSFTWQRIPLPEGLEIGVIHSGVSHDNAGGSYNQRRTECEEAARQLGVETLGELTLRDLGRILGLPDPLGRRVRHVVTENWRVMRAVQALSSNDVRTLGHLFWASHRSLRDDFEASIPAIDRLVALAARDSRVQGARITGGGFGGCVVFLAAQSEARKAGEGLVSAYRRETGLTGRLLLPLPA